MTETQPLKLNTRLLPLGADVHCVLCGKGADLENTGVAPVADHLYAVVEGPEEQGVICRNCMQQRQPVFLALFMDLRRTQDQAEYQHNFYARSERGQHLYSIDTLANQIPQELKQHKAQAEAEAKRAIPYQMAHIEARRRIFVAYQKLEGAVKAARPAASAYATAAFHERDQKKAESDAAKEVWMACHEELRAAKAGLAVVDRALLVEMLGYEPE